MGSRVGKDSLSDQAIKLACTNILQKYKSDKVFDKKDAMRFVIEAMKQAGGKAQNNLLGFDAWFKSIDKKKCGFLEIA